MYLLRVPVIEKQDRRNDFVYISSDSNILRAKLQHKSFICYVPVHTKLFFAFFKINRVNFEQI